MRTPSVASGGGTDVLIAVQDFTVPTASGTNSFTSTTFAGKTPKAAFFVSSCYDPASGTGQTSNAQIALGSLANNAVGFCSLNQTSGTRRGVFFTYPLVLQRLSNSGLRFSSSGSFVTDGVSLNGTAGATEARRAAFVGFAGADVTADNNTVALGTGTSAISASIGFQPDLVIFYASDDAFDSGSNLINYSASIGFATKDGTQRVVTGSQSANNTPLQALLTNRCGGFIDPSTGSMAYDLTVGGFSSSGFTVTPSASAGSKSVGYLALKIGGKRCKIVDLTTPTSTGSQAITGAGFTPQFAIVVLTNLETVNPTFPVTTDDTMAGLSVNLVGDEQWATSAACDSGSQTTFSQQKNVAVIGPSSTDADAISATLTSFDSDGMTLNYTAVQGTAKKGFILFIE